MERKITAVFKRISLVAALVGSMVGAVHMIGGSAIALTQADCRGCHGSGTTLSVSTIHHNLVQTKGFECSHCHQTVPDGMGGYTVTVPNDCFLCHQNESHDTVHNAIVKPVECAACHTLPGIQDVLAGGSTCATCHDSTVPEVQQVIANGKAGLTVNCIDCHQTIPLNGHVHPYFQTAAECATCHFLPPIEEHTTRGSMCSTCHSSTSTFVMDAIAAGKAGQIVTCLNCHGSGYSHKPAHVKTYAPYADCATCHTGTLPILHQIEGFACSTCHSSTAPAHVKDAVSASAAGGTIYCATCHTTFGNHAVQHNSVAVPTSTDFISTHEQSSLTSYCFDCHNTTVPAREQAIDNGMKNVPVSCTACHPTMVLPNIPPTANAGPDVTGYTNQPITFSGAGSSDPDGGTITSYHWNFGDGAMADGITASHTYTTAGSYWTTLTVTDNAGGVSTDSAVVTVLQGIVYTPVDEALTVTRLSSATNGDSSGTRTTVTTQFKDNNLTTGYAVSYSSRSGYNVVTLRTNKDALTAATKVVLRFYVSTISGTQTVRVYPYLSGFTNVNSTSSASYSITGTGWKELDVTTLARQMNGLGAMKFRLTTTGSFNVSEGNFIVQ